MIPAKTARPEHAKAYLYLHFAVILWGATGVLGRAIELNEGLLVWYRIMLVSVTLFGYLLFVGADFRISKKQFQQLLLIGTVLIVHWVLFFGAIKYSNVSIALSLLSSVALFTALIEPLLIKRKFDAAELFYSLMGMAGILFIFYHDDHMHTMGIIMGILAAFVGSFFNILNKKIVGQLSAQVVTFYEMTLGFAVLTLLLPFYLHATQPTQLLPSATDWILLLILSVVCTDIAFILALHALRYFSAFTVNLAINLEPLYGILLAFAIYHENEELTVWFFIGAALIMSSVALHAYFSKTK